MAIIRETVDKVIRKILKENPEQIYKQSKEMTQKEWIRTLGKYYFIGQLGSRVKFHRFKKTDWNFSICLFFV